MTTPLRDAAPSPPPTTAPTPAEPPLLQALAHVNEVDLARGLGPRRLAEVQHLADRDPPRPRTRWLRLLWYLAAAISLLLLVLER